MEQIAGYIGKSHSKSDICEFLHHCLYAGPARDVFYETALAVVDKIVGNGTSITRNLHGIHPVLGHDIMVATMTGDTVQPFAGATSASQTSPAGKLTLLLNLQKK